MTQPISAPARSPNVVHTRGRDRRLDRTSAVAGSWRSRRCPRAAASTRQGRPVLLVKPDEVLYASPRRTWPAHVDLVA